MGIVNVTTDSFSDGGRFIQAERAIEHGLALTAAGADLVDIGGESTRPGADRVPVEVERANVVPVIRALSQAGVLVSVDTTRAVVAEAAVLAGARVINDISAGLADASMAGVVADAGLPYVAMHWRAPSAVMHRYACYRDVVAEVTEELCRRVDALVGAGVNADRIVLDPGLGYAKQAHHNWQLLDRLDELCRIGPPVLVGASRKSFLHGLLRSGDTPANSAALDSATAAVSSIAARAGVFCVRVHDVVGSLLAVQVAQACLGGDPTPPHA
jgi:dihydropteroate synthase